MKFLFFLLYFIPCFCFSQTDSIPKNAAGNYEYTGVVNVDSASADKLYSNAKIFIVDAFKFGKEVTQLNDDNTKTVAGSGTQRIHFKGGNSALNYFVKFKFVIQCKDGRYKYTIGTFELTDPGRSTTSLENEKALKHFATKNMREQILQQVSGSMQKFIFDLQKNMYSQTDKTKDW